MTKLKEQEVELKKAKVNAENSHHLAEARLHAESLHLEKNTLTKRY